MTWVDVQVYRLYAIPAGASAYDTGYPLEAVADTKEEALQLAAGLVAEGGWWDGQFGTSVVNSRFVQAIRVQQITEKRQAEAEVVA